MEKKVPSPTYMAPNSLPYLWLFCKCRSSKTCSVVSPTAVTLPPPYLLTAHYIHLLDQLHFLRADLAPILGSCSPTETRVSLEVFAVEQNYQGLPASGGELEQAL